MVRLLAWLLSLAMAGGCFVLVLIMLIVQGYSQNLPDIDQLQNYAPPVVSRVHAADGRLMAEFASERRVFVPIERVPQRVINAFLSAEDKNFYSHTGVDFTGLARAVVVNLKNIGRGHRPVGASTITQQVAKNFLVGDEVSIARKIREAVLAFRIERAYSKDEILELYLNKIFLGQRAYGVGSAALAYFNKTLDELTVAEAAYLAALPKAPNNYHPEDDKAAAVGRRNWVIERMLEDGAIMQPDYDVAIKEPLEIRPRQENEIYNGGAYAAEDIRRELIKMYGETALMEGGFVVRSTINPHIQDAATTALQNGLMAYDRRHGWRGALAHIGAAADIKTMLEKYPMPAGGERWALAAVTSLSPQAAEILLKSGLRGSIPLEALRWAGAVRKVEEVLHVGDIILVEKQEGEGKKYDLRQIPAVQGALVAMDVHTGRVLAMVGGFSPKMSAFNRATQAYRQPGSSFKPFVYMAGLEAGFTPSSLILDAPISLPQGAGLPEWKPSNFEDDYLGPTSLRVGVEKSRNVMTVRLAMQTGLNNVAKVVQDFGVIDKMQHNFSTVLGSGETTVLRMATGYAQIVNGGRKITPTLIDSIEDKTGHSVYKHDTRPCKGCAHILWREGMEPPTIPDNRPSLIDPRTAYQMVHILEGVIERGTGSRTKGLPWPVAGKTGTTNDAKDNWFCGFTADMAVALYIGFDQPVSLGKKVETGGANAAPIFKEFIANALEGTPPVPFRVPAGLRLVRVDAATGRLAQGYEKNIIWEAFKPNTEPTAAPAAPIDPDLEEAGFADDIVQPEGNSTEVIQMPDEPTVP